MTYHCGKKVTQERNHCHCDDFMVVQMWKKILWMRKGKNGDLLRMDGWSWRKEMYREEKEERKRKLFINNNGKLSVSSDTYWTIILPDTRYLSYSLGDDYYLFLTRLGQRRLSNKFYFFTLNCKKCENSLCSYERRNKVRASQRVLYCLSSLRR